MQLRQDFLGMKVGNAEVRHGPARMAQLDRFRQQISGLLGAARLRRDPGERAIGGDLPEPTTRLVLSNRKIGMALCARQYTLEGAKYRTQSVNERPRKPISGVLIAQDRLHHVLVSGFAFSLHPSRIGMEDFSERD